jgi:hypothetical protein
MTERAYEHLVGSRRFGYSAYFGMVADAARAAMRRTRRKSARSVETTEIGLVLRDWFGHELPSRVPGGQEQFRMRLALAEIRLLKGEDDRLTAHFAEHGPTCAKVLGDQFNTLNGILSEIGELRGTRTPIRETAHIFPAMSRFRDAAASEDRDWPENWAKLSAEVCAAAGGADDAALPAAVQTALDAIRIRYKALGDRYARFNTLYQSEFDRLGDRIELARKQLSWTISRQAFSQKRNADNWRKLVDQTTGITSAWLRGKVRAAEADDASRMAKLIRRAAAIVRARRAQ